MKGRKLFIVIVLLLALGLPVLAQQQFRLRIYPPPPNQLGVEDLWSLEITNNSSGQPMVYLRGRIKKGGNDIFRASTNEFESPPPRGKLRIKARDIRELRDEFYVEKYKSFIERTGSVPAGNYDACLELIDAASGALLADECIPITVRPASPPRLISPKAGKGIKVKRPTFTWTKPAPVPAQERVLYKIRIVEIYEGQSKEEAMRSNPVWYEESGINRTSFMYPLRGRELDPDKRYAWQVQSFYADGLPLGRDNGMSEIWEINPDIIKDIKPLLVPKYLKIGDFVIKNITYTSSSKDSLSGSGESYFIKKNPPAGFGGPMYLYVEIPFDVTFNNLQANWPSGSDTANIISGEIEESFSSPLAVPVEGYIVSVHDIHMLPDTASGIIAVKPACLYDTTGCDPVEFGPFREKLSPLLDVHEELSVAERGPYRLGETGIIIKSTGKVVIDLSRTITPSKVGIDLKRGETVEQPKMDTCNTGYLYAKYTFNNGVLKSDGFSATFELASPWRFWSLIPLGFEVNLTSGELEIEKCKVKKGKFVNGEIVLPSDSNGVVDPAGNKVIAKYDSILVDTLLSLSSKVSVERQMKWGGFGLSATNTYFRITANPYAYHTVVQSDTFTRVKKDTLVGLIIPELNRTFDTLIVYSGDVSYPLKFKNMGATFNKIMGGGWFNLEMQGIRGFLSSDPETPKMYVRLGLPTKTGYVCDSSFNTVFTHDETDSTFMKFWFVGNSSFDTDLRGKFRIPYPSNIKPPFREVGVTSTASFVGGNAFFPDTTLPLDYWGVGLSSKRGVVSVRMGEIIYTNAEIEEPVHFSTGFNIIWGEMLADGDLGEFYFNHNAAHQKFDGFPITLDSAGLSKFDERKAGGELVVRSGIHFNFFGEPDTFITVHDENHTIFNPSPPPDRITIDSLPYQGRRVTIDPEEFDLYRDWGSGIAEMDFDEVRYDSMDQNGFIGTGDVAFNFFQDSTVHADIEIDSLYIKICVLETRVRNLLLLDVELTSLGEIWGCAVIKGDELDRIAVGARIESSVGGGFDLLVPKAGVGIEVKMAITPNITTFAADGIMYLSVLTADIEMNGSVFFRTDRSAGSVEGELKGAFDLSSLGVDLEAEGQANWFFSGSTNYIQGRLAVKLCTLVFGSGLAGGMFIGYQAPLNQIWVIQEGSSANRRFGIDAGDLVSPVTGLYVFGDYEASIDFGIVSGGIEIYAGVGAFLTGSYTGADGVTSPEDGDFVIVGVVGVYIYGDILWGLVSASAWGELKIFFGTLMGFEGTFGLRGCVLWGAICGEIEIVAGINSRDGFYVE